MSSLGCSVSAILVAGPVLVLCSLGRQRSRLSLVGTQISNFSLLDYDIHQGINMTPTPRIYQMQLPRTSHVQDIKSGLGQNHVRGERQYQCPGAHSLVMKTGRRDPKGFRAHKQECSRREGRAAALRAIERQRSLGEL